MTSPRTNLKNLVKEASEIYGKMIENRNFNLLRSSRQHVLTNLNNIAEEKIIDEVLTEHQNQLNKMNYLTFGSNRRLENLLEGLANVANAILYKTTIENAQKLIEELKYKGQTIIVTNTPAANSKPQDTQPEINFEACYNSWADKAIKAIKSIPPKPEEKPVLTPLQQAEKKTKALEDQLTSIIAEKLESQKKAEDRKKEIDALNVNLNETQKKLSSAESLSFSLTHDMQDLQKQLKETKTSYESQINGMVFDYDAKISKLKEQKELSFKSLNDQLTQQKQKVKASETLNFNIAKEIQTLNNEKSDLEKKLSFAKQEFSTSQAALVNQTISNKKLETQLHDEQNEKNEKLKTLYEAQKKLRTESLAKIDLENRLKEYENKTTDLNKQKLKLQATCGELHKKVATLEEELKKAKLDHKALEDTHNEIMAKQAASVAITIDEEDNSTKGYATRARKNKGNYGMFTKTNKPGATYSSNFGGPASGPK